MKQTNKTDHKKRQDKQTSELCVCMQCKNEDENEGNENQSAV